MASGEKEIANEHVTNGLCQPDLFNFNFNILDVYVFVRIQ